MLRSGFNLLLFVAVLIFAPGARALEMQVSTGLYYYPSEAAKVFRAETETAEDGLAFRATRNPRDVAHDLAEEELHDGNVCLRQVRSDLRESVKKWRVRELCDRFFRAPANAAMLDAQRARLHPDHLECEAGVEAREQGGELRLQLVFRAQLVMRDRAPAKLRRAGIGGELTRWDLPVQEDVLGEAKGSWKEALKTGACSADGQALDAFWKRLQDRAAQARELAECRNHDASEADSVARLQKSLSDYVPDDWLAASGGDDVKGLLEPLPPLDRSASLGECKQSRAESARRLDKLRSLSAKIAGKYDVPVLEPASGSDRRPASADPADDEED